VALAKPAGAEEAKEMVTSSTTPVLSELALAHERNEGLLGRGARSYYAKRVEDALAHWHEDARWEAAYTVTGLPGVVEVRAALTEMIAGLVAIAERVEVHDVRFNQTDDPDVAFIEERMTLDLGRWALREPHRHAGDVSGRPDRRHARVLGAARERGAPAPAGGGGMIDEGRAGKVLAVVSTGVLVAMRGRRAGEQHR
jgi:hypothetical protein